MKKWNIEGAEEFFMNAELPATLRLDEVQTITDVPKFIETHLNFCKVHRDKPYYKRYWYRLRLAAKRIKELNQTK